MVMSPLLPRRTVLAALPLLLLAPPAPALPPRTLVFPRDHGAHPELHTEWWYVTGWAEAAGGRLLGFQLTFFRSRVDAAAPLESRFAAKQLVFAHAAVTDLQAGRLLHAQRIARAGFGVAETALEDTRIRLRDWTLARGTEGRYAARLPGPDFGLDLHFTPTQPLLLQGQAGLSRKGPQEAQASYYYSQPQLQAEGSIALGGKVLAVRGRAWLDHEWSEALLHPEAVGWDWIGMNLDDGGALTAFQLRRADGSALWTGGSWRDAAGRLRVFGDGDLRFTAGRRWRSAASGADYPVQWRLETPAGAFEVRSLLDGQELDGSGSTGSTYWEGLSDLLDAQGRRVGRGYLEMTGYAQRLRL